MSLITLHYKKYQVNEKILKSIDKMDNDDNSCLYPIEFLNSLEVNGLPAHNLKLKKRTVIMLLRNLNTYIRRSMQWHKINC